MLSLFPSRFLTPRWLLSDAMESFVNLAEMKRIHFDHVMTRRSGQRRFVDLHMHMPSDWTLGRAAGIRNGVEQALMEAIPGLRATIQLLPADCATPHDALACAEDKNHSKGKL